MDGNLEKPIKKMLDITPGKGAKSKALSSRSGNTKPVKWTKKMSDSLRGC